ncbi:F-BAR domain only protein 2-like isoform X4 [Portunus trituberculatus]|uniref:F-BAR domain only protein 2-like isoform X4 n=1 Tax=Portunus trituberculatus TaxID=210409 RepID=UPI001E1D14CE|nr:F-BAR domain only protein 2-like isoform X4 [Portunus trituberculatus]
MLTVCVDLKKAFDSVPRETLWDLLHLCGIPTRIIGLLTGLYSGTGEEHNGWNVLYQNMKQGQTASKELAEFFKERWSIDETYSKSLVKLANKANSNTEKGTYAPIFGVLRQSSEKLSSIHSTTVQRVQELVKEVVKYNDELHKKHKVVKDEESQTEEIVKSIQATSGLAQKAKETYGQRCQDLEKVRRDGASPKELEKAEAKLKKAHDEYRSLVDKYNNIREEFEKRMTTSCMNFQSVEETHLVQMLKFVNTYICVLQSNHEAMGQVHQDLLNQCSKHSVEKLLDMFALSKHTGLEKPNAMVFEESESIGSGVSGQQSPEPADQSKASVEDTGGSGGSSAGGVLAGGSVVVTKPGRMESGKKLLRDRTSIFSISRVTSRSSSATAAGSGSHVGSGGNISRVTVNASASSCSSKILSTFTQDHSSSPELKANTPSRNTSSVKGNFTCATSLNKPSRRTTSLLNLFVASTSSAGRSEREWSAPPSCDSGGGEDSQDGDVGERDTESLPPSPAKASPARVTSAPTSPTATDDSSLGRTVFRSSKLSLPGGTPVLSFGFLRSRRDRKIKEKKVKKKKDADSSSNKEEKSDNEGNDDSGAKTSDPATVVVTSASDKGSISGQTPNVDEEGFSVRPQEQKAAGEDNSFDSSSDTDSDAEPEKKIHVEIKPISNGNAPLSPSVDELRATIEGMSLSPASYPSTRRTSTDASDSFSMKRSYSITQPPSNKSSSVDLLGLNLNFGNSESPRSTAGSESSFNRPISPVSKGVSSPAPSITSVTSPILAPPPRADRYAELSDILNETEPETPPALPPRTGGGSSSRGSTPTPTMAIPRPPSRKSIEGPARGRQSPSTVLPRAESVSSLEFRTSGMMGTSRGPSPLTIGLSDTIPLAVAFQELCHAYFRGTDESRCQVKVTGEMMVSFPAGIVGVLANNPSPAQLSFKVNNIAKITNVLPNKQLITMDEEQSTSDYGIFNFNMNALTSLLRKQAEGNPSASYFNVDMIKYQVNTLNGATTSPLQLVSYWKCEDNHTDLRIDYKYNPHALASPSPLLNVNVMVPVDGIVKNMQSKPQGQWLKDQQRAVWKLTELSPHSTNNGVGSLRGKFEVAAGPSTPATVSTQFNCEGTTISGLEFNLLGSGYRVSLVKKRFVSGKYICDADAVLRLRYGSIPS